ncbi:ABC transporter ATP-binding protein [Clostridium sp. 'deep sea']|uniref:ABC transporter ATP-binding protein n=1 Tax=Clostridium sp. 'deep sea' TaxID=2779445 RepID=UPI001896926B|nr:ABC transporter ATP-binding protein [Clostridium sp. 'deep sea']QOR36413.1 ABC transporter ATP-binding protein [Clostridium sp. 'deep sea']
MKKYLHVLNSIHNKKKYYFFIILGCLSWMALEFVFTSMIGSSYKSMLAGNFRDLIFTVVILFSIMQLLNVLQNIFDYLYGILSLKSVAILRQKLVQTVLQEDYKFVDRIDSGKIVTLLNSDMEHIEAYYRITIPSFVSSIFLFLGGLYG